MKALIAGSVIACALSAYAVSLATSANLKPGARPGAKAAQAEEAQAEEAQAESLAAPVLVVDDQPYPAGQPGLVDPPHALRGGGGEPADPPPPQSQASP